MSVHFLDLKAAYLELQPEIDAAIKRVLDSGWYILGEEVDAFEQEYAAYCEAQHYVAVANGLDALHLALLALGVDAYGNLTCAAVNAAFGITGILPLANGGTHQTPQQTMATQSFN
jgi:dTDP-4-amino-4,6-dideoxygalactose transaminase